MFRNKLFLLITALVILQSCKTLNPIRAFADETGNSHWQILSVASEAIPREDCAFVEAGGKFFLIGGRGIKPVEVFDLATNEWTKKGSTPFEMNHFQGVTYKGEIYVVGGMTGSFPHEVPLTHIYIYNPAKDEWRKGAEIPATRRRGSGGSVVYKNKIYTVCGITDGHWLGTVNWLDEFDPATQQWRTLANAPHARDHFHAAIINNELYLAGGRRTSFATKNIAGLTEHSIDVYDFKKRSWSTLQDADSLPTARAGSTSVVIRNNLVVIGGESLHQKISHNQVEVYNTKTKTWKTLPTLISGRHDTQAIYFNDAIYIAAGSANAGGGPDLGSIEMLALNK